MIEIIKLTILFLSFALYISSVMAEEVSIKLPECIVFAKELVGDQHPWKKYWWSTDQHRFFGKYPSEWIGSDFVVARDYHKNCKQHYEKHGSWGKRLYDNTVDVLKDAPELAQEAQRVKSVEFKIKKAIDVIEKSSRSIYMEKQEERLEQLENRVEEVEESSAMSELQSAIAYFLGIAETAKFEGRAHAARRHVETLSYFEGRYNEKLRYVEKKIRDEYDRIKYERAMAEVRGALNNAMADIDIRSLPDSPESLRALEAITKKVEKVKENMPDDLPDINRDQLHRDLQKVEQSVRNKYDEIKYEMAIAEARGALNNAMADIRSLPDSPESLRALEAILKKVEKVKENTPGDRTMLRISLGSELHDIEKIAERKVVEINRLAKCAGKMPETGLPKAVYGKPIVVLYHPYFAVSFETLFCITINKGHFVQYIAPLFGANYVVEIKNDVTTIILTFAKIPNKDAWILKDAILDGEKYQFSPKDSLQLLTRLLN